MNYKLLLIGIFAIVASYLVFSLPVASATTVKVYYNGVPQPPSVQYNPQSFVKKSVSVSSGNVVISVTNGTSSASIEKVFVYKCGGLAPATCASSVTPETGESSFDGSYTWSSVADKTTGYPQRANFMIFVKVIVSGKAFWTGFWQWIERSDSSTYTPHESQMGEIQVHAKDIDDVATIGNFITTNRMIPFNPQWVTKIVFPAASGLYLVKSGLDNIDMHQFTTSEVPQNYITSIDQDYGFAFGNGTGVFLPVTLNLNPNYNCGNGNCEAEKGETKANCCMDCACQAGYYCDAGSGCKQVSKISLVLYGTPQTGVSNCNQQHILNISVKVDNPPTGMAVSSSKYKLGSSPYMGTSCIAAPGNIFSCHVTVPAVPNCQAGTYRVGPNYINFSISYPDGKDTTTGFIAVSFPDVTIGSYSCGNGVCESSIGESPANCCYDCGCTTGYCNAQASNPETGSCKTDPSNGNLVAAGLMPSSFYTHAPGDMVRFYGQVTNSPVTLSVTGDSCSIRCMRSDGQACSSICDVSCSKVSSNDTSVYNSTCSMSFSITGYDTLKGFSLYPTLNFSVSYTNGSVGTVQKVLSSQIQTIGIGAHFCGDKKCDPDEASTGCCYDCACPEGQYCDTQNLAYKSEGDSCKPEPLVSIDSTSTAVFTDSYDEHVINVTGHASNRPGGVEITPTCIFSSALSGVPCYPSCQETNDSSPQTYRFLCHVVVPPIDYNSSSFYDPASRKITLSPNSLNITLSYNNGPSKKVQDSFFSLPELIINVIPRCGNGVCEAGIDETPNSCCIDCECSLEHGKGYFCYTGKNPNGECLSDSDISMRVREIQPDPVNCIISYKGKGCLFTSSVKAYPEIINPPSDLEIAAAYYIVGVGGNYSNSTALNCFKSNQGVGNYSCPLILENSKGETQGNETRTLELKMSLSYTLDGAIMFKNVSDSFNFTVKRTYSEAVANCIEEQASINKKISKLKSDKTIYGVLAIIFLIIFVVFLILYIISCYKSCTESFKTIATTAMTIAACALSFIMSQMENINQKIQELQQRKQAVCAATGFGDLSKATSAGSSGIDSIGKTVSGMLCAMGVSGAMSSNSGGASSSGTATAGTGGGLTGQNNYAGLGTTPASDIG